MASWIQSVPMPSRYGSCLLVMLVMVVVGVRDQGDEEKVLQGRLGEDEPINSSSGSSGRGMYTETSVMTPQGRVSKKYVDGKEITPGNSTLGDADPFAGNSIDIQPDPLPPYTEASVTIQRGPPAPVYVETMTASGGPPPSRETKKTVDGQEYVPPTPEPEPEPEVKEEPATISVTHQFAPSSVSSVKVAPQLPPISPSPVQKTFNFSRYDKNGDGVLDKDELNNLKSDLKSNTSINININIDIAIQNADKDRDGGLNKNEFTNLLINIGINIS